ncbi:MAG TPA: cyclic nucleotide-binding domain-containing protein [Saprospiraceae bacterium]|nr:cyclic nucleotide-binding domain-containing protein [Saprospiraceae bacterium]HMQ85006.1 cyclic nucleotide-binding domain-containing protein [Saprospiraceae bacterium]
MHRLLEHISLQWDLWVGVHRAFFPTAEEDIVACQELKKKTANADYPEQLYVACQDTRSGELVACLHLREAAPADFAIQQFDYTLFYSGQSDKMLIADCLCVNPSYEKPAPAVSLLLAHCFVEILKAGGHAMLMSCDLQRYAIFKRVGMRPIGGLKKLDEHTFHIPMICLPDLDYLSAIHSPVLPLLRGVDLDRYQTVCQWYYDLLRDHSELRTGAAFYSDEESDFDGHHVLTEGLSESGKEMMLKNALIMNCREGEVLIQENSGGTAFGFVRKGLINVVIGNKTVVMLGEGDIFGEIAYILNSKRTAQVVAASPDTEVVLFSEAAITKLEKEADRTALWRNLAKVLAQRVMLTNKLLG